MSLLDKLLKAIPDFNLLKIDNLYINGEHINVKNGKAIIDKREVKFLLDKKGGAKLDIDGNVYTPFEEGKKENIKKIDNQGQVFTRADLASSQIEFSTISDEHEALIKKIKPLLTIPRFNPDLGALLAASSVIQIEDKHQNEELARKLIKNLNTGYGHRGSMIYNLFRSGLLRYEVLHHLKTLKKSYPNSNELVKTHFLIYWNFILDSGYPTAYFVGIDDAERTLHTELEKRIENGANAIWVYSRTEKRNKNTEKWCRNFAAEHSYKCNKVKSYQLGFTPAIKMRIIPKELSKYK